MTAFVVRRLLSGLLLVALLTFVTFVVFNTIPTNPACLVVACGPKTTTSDAQIRAADHRLGIDRSVFVQYGDFIWRLGRHGDLGVSWTGNFKVGQAIGRSLPATASLVIGGMALMMLLALPLSCIGAARPRSVIDRGVLAASVIGLAIHPFVLGIMLRDIFGQHLGVPDFGYCPLSRTSQSMHCGGVRDWASHMAVPWLVFALLFLPFYVRMLRARLIETMSESWISTARAKGASEMRVIFGHALRNAIGPVLPMIAIDAGTAITAAIYIETVFGLPGIGLLAVQALSGEAGGYDLPLTAGIVTIVGAFVVLLNIAADVAAGWLNPRTRTRSVTVIQLPEAILSFPRARQGLIGGLAALAIAVFVIAAIYQERRASLTADIGNPVRVFLVHWDDSYRLTGQGRHGVLLRGSLKTKVMRIELGSKGWRIQGAVTNATSLPVPISQTPGATYPHQGMSLLVSTVGSDRVRRPMEALSAEVFSPPFPRVLRPGATWRGTFAGTGSIRRLTKLAVGFGEFNWDSRLISTATGDSIVAR